MDEQNLRNKMTDTPSLQRDINSQLEAKVVPPEGHSKKNLIIAGVILLVIIVGIAVYLLLPQKSEAPVEEPSLTASQKLEVLSQLKSADAVTAEEKKSSLKSLQSNTSVTAEEKQSVLQNLKAVQ